MTRFSTAGPTGRPAAPALRLALWLALALVPRMVSAQNAVDTFYPGANSDVDTVALQADGKILVGGSLTMLGSGGTGTTTRNRIGRVNADASSNLRRCRLGVAAFGLEQIDRRGACR